MADKWKLNTPWTPEKVAILKRMWCGCSASEIAKKLGFTRNSVIGKAYRLGLSDQIIGVEKSKIWFRPALTPTGRWARACKYGHLSARHKDGSCIECRRQYNRARSNGIKAVASALGLS